MAQETKPGNTTADLLKEIRENLSYGLDYWREIREEAAVDMRYVAGDPWPPQEKKARTEANRPALVLDEISQYINQVVNDLRAKKRAIKISPIGGSTRMDEMTRLADFRGNLIRQIEYESKAQQAYITAFENTVQRGYGWFRVNTAYVSDNSFEQKLAIRRIPNPDTVLPDPDFREADGSDMRWCFVLDYVPRSQFKKRWPKAEIRDFTEELGLAPEWVREHEIRIAEYWRAEHKQRRLLLVRGAPLFPEPVQVFADELVSLDGLEVLRERKVVVACIRQYITNGLEILEEKDWAGRWIPLIPVWGRELFLDEGQGAKRKLLSLVRLARDPYMLYCYIRSAQQEAIGITPKVPYIGYEGQFEGHEEEWATAHQIPRGFLQAKPTTESSGGQVLPLPQRLPYEPPIVALEAAAESAKRSIMNAMAMYNVSVGRGDTRATSGIAIEKLQAASYSGQFHLLDNFDRALQHAGRILNDLIPEIYDTEREVALRDQNDKYEVARINGADCKYNTTQGEFDVTVAAGPSFATQREEASSFADALAAANPAIFGRIGDLVVKLKNLGPIGDEMAKRLTPPEFAAQEGQEPLPPQAIAMIQQMQQQMQALNAYAQKVENELQQLKQERMAKVIETESRERIAVMENQTKLLLEEARIRQEGALTMLKAEIDRLREDLKQRHEHALADHEAALKPNTQPPMAAQGRGQTAI